MKIARTLLLGALAVSPLALGQMAESPGRVAQLSYVEGRIGFQGAGEEESYALPQRPARDAACAPRFGVRAPTRLIGSRP